MRKNIDFLLKKTQYFQIEKNSKILYDLVSFDLLTILVDGFTVQNSAFTA